MSALTVAPRMSSSTLSTTFCSWWTASFWWSCLGFFKSLLMLKGRQHATIISHVLAGLICIPSPSKHQNLFLSWPLTCSIIDRVLAWALKENLSASMLQSASYFQCMKEFKYITTYYSNKSNCAMLVTNVLSATSPFFHFKTIS